MNPSLKKSLMQIMGSRNKQNAKSTIIIVQKLIMVAMQKGLNFSFWK